MSEFLYRFVSLSHIAQQFDQSKPCMYISWICFDSISKSGNSFFTLFPVHLQNDFRIGMGGKMMAPLNQRLSQLDVVVNFSVEADHIIPIDHGLMPGAQINDR